MSTLASCHDRVLVATRRMRDVAWVKTTPLHPTIYLYTARALRDFGDGFVAMLLPVYLTALGFTPFQVGLLATAAMLGSALLTLGRGHRRRPLRSPPIAAGGSEPHDRHRGGLCRGA